MNAQTQIQIQPAQNVSVGFLNKDSFEMTLRTAKMLSSSTLVPADYRGESGIANCAIALNMASRIGADPLMVMQNLIPIHGRPSWSAQFLIATFNSCGRFTSMKFEFFGEENTDAWGCRAVATEKATGEKLTGTSVTIGIAKSEGWYSKNGSKWRTIPQQMLTYRAASWFVRAYAPELSMGLHTQEEIYDTLEEKEINPKSDVNEILKNEPAPKPVVINHEEVEQQVSASKTEEITDEEALNVLTGEDPYADIKAKIAACNTKADIGRLYAAQKEPTKSFLKPFFQQRQNEIQEIANV